MSLTKIKFKSGETIAIKVVKRGHTNYQDNVTTISMSSLKTSLKNWCTLP